MQKKILLVSFNNFKQPYPVFPIGVAYLAGALKALGYIVQIFDRNFSNDIEKQVADFGPDLIGISIRNVDDIRIENTQYFIPEITDFVNRIKNVSKVPVILGGSAFSLFPEMILTNSGADFGIAGEGEQSFPVFIEKFMRNELSIEQLIKIPGLIFRSNGKIYKNGIKLCDLANLVHPFRDENFISLYNNASSIVNIQTQRGCPYKCCYCTYPLIEGTMVRQFSPSFVGEEMERIKRSGAQYLFIVDSVFNITADHVSNICEEIIRRNINLPWGCYLRPQGLTSELMRLMKRAGLQHIEFGSDSLCDEILCSYGKCFTFEDIFTASKLARNENINYSHFLIVGGPNESENTLRKSFDNSKKIYSTVFFPFIGMRLYPGTRLFKIAIDEGFTSPSDDLLDPIFYLSPHLTLTRTKEILEEFNRCSHNWIISTDQPETTVITERLRKRGIVGPLWEYLAR